MPSRLPADCLNEIFDYLEEDKPTLHSCLLVNRLWCKISIRILWRNIWDLKYSVTYQHRPKVASAILSTLVACLPNESKELLYKNGIFIPTPTSKPPLFNYVAFCKVLSICEIGRIIDDTLEKIPITSQSLKDRKSLIANEIIKMFINQISSLKLLMYYLIKNIPYDISFDCFFGARNYLINLSELGCNSNLPSEFFDQITQICHNLQSLTINFENEISNELKKLISLQNNLKNLYLFAFDGGDWTNIIPTLTKHSNTLTKLHLYSDHDDNLPLSFVSLFPNLQEIKFSFSYVGTQFEDFEKLQNVNFPKLQFLSIPYQCPKPEYVMRFLENNGKNLKVFYTEENNRDLNLSIAKFCPNLINLFIVFSYNELDVLKTIFNNCQYLESIKIWCGDGFLSEKEVLETVAKYSPKNFRELKIYNDPVSELLPEDLESFFIIWKNRTPKKSLTLIIIKEYDSNLELNKENMEIIEKYKKLGIIKKFETKEYGEDESKNYI
ncbi:hypothetical protein C1645_876268 [Glomus cerebriforme]|uniref:F-box domain-containing protein n=1 Tax=Glomus cerebriforme TaxID=658196 RepID=A0A397SVZ5_9GLOM|nr:hypothetical protein C1645_876268 [Glomus cerebriforme]